LLVAGLPAEAFLVTTASTKALSEGWLLVIGCSLLVYQPKHF
jgi:hypothetical protein